MPGPPLGHGRPCRQQRPSWRWPRLRDAFARRVPGLRSRTARSWIASGRACPPARTGKGQGLCGLSECPCALIYAHTNMIARGDMRTSIGDARLAPLSRGMSILARNIDLIIRHYRWNQGEAAAEFGVAQPTVSRWRSGVEPRKLDGLARAAALAGVSIEELRTVPLTRIGERPMSSPGAQLIMLPVNLPSVERLTVMFRGLLRQVGLEDQADEHAETLARRLPGALAQAAGDLAPPESAQETTRDEPAQHRATPHPDQPR